MQAALDVPTYPAKGMVIVHAAATRPPAVHGMACASLPHTTLVAGIPGAP